MPLQLFLNELSVPSLQLAHAVSVGHLQKLVSTIREACGIDPALILNSDLPLANFPLGGQSTIASIRNAGECVEESLYLKTVNSRAPLTLVAAETADKHPDPGLCEYRLRPDAPLLPRETALGLGFAHLFDGLSLSLATHDFWIEQSIELDLSALNATGEVLTSQVVARNADSPAAITRLANTLRMLLTPTIAHGAELWERRSELLPNLVFIPRTRAQLEAILPGDPMLEQAWIKLRGIDQAIQAWKIAKAPYPMFPFSVRPESRSRRALAAFEDIEGNSRIFSEHCDLAPTEARIHFIVATVPQRHALIGHIGRKLGIG